MRMEHRIITGSITYAIKGRDVLKREGYKARIERKASENKSGCGYAIIFDGDLLKAKEILEKSGVKMLNII